MNKGPGEHHFFLLTLNLNALCSVLKLLGLQPAAGGGEDE